MKLPYFVIRSTHIRWGVRFAYRHNFDWSFAGCQSIARADKFKEWDEVIEVFKDKHLCTGQRWGWENDILEVCKDGKVKVVWPLNPLKALAAAME